MSKTTTIVREAPTIVYKVTQVVGGKSPKIEVTIRLGGDVSKVAKNLEKNLVKPMLETLRKAIKEELTNWNDE